MQSATGPRVAKLFCVALTLVLYSAPGYAYLDPGTGSIILQSVLAGFAVAIGVLRLYWHRFKAYISGLTGASPSAENDLEQGLVQDSEGRDES